MRRKHKDIDIVSWVILACSIFWLMPLLLIFINSFKPYNDMIQHFLSLPSSINFNMYEETWTTFKFSQLTLTTLLYTVCTVLGVVICAPMAAYKLARTKTKYSTVIFGLIILPMMVPFQAYMITLTKLVSKVGLNGTKIGYIMVSVGLCMPLAVFMIHGFIKGIPLELEESALIDGASRYRTYFSVVLPLLKPILTTVIVLDALATWNDVITNQLIVGGKQNALNIQNALYMQFSAQTADWEHALPGIVMSTIPSLIFFVFMQKHIVGGITAGAVKG
ncbi:ABC transporter permease subunit [Anaerocolumna sedimenticola]|uniref:ABC transporter permease subunit n=1 Tax=Anaerocolumna sedimenticola TaxID=2696063 RepID=A0A6P1TK75_9FIRM|nr:carbohydrate ABC transporter permease [Anaerocolumna sedimenticola]QHQ60519.1 ABC transporter permease subunit [Anaerocolumna sedimenticola]